MESGQDNRVGKLTKLALVAISGAALVFLSGGLLENMAGRNDHLDPLLFRMEYLRICAMAREPARRRIRRVAASSPGGFL